MGLVLTLTALIAILRTIYRKATAKPTKDDKEITVNVRTKSAPNIIIKAEKRNCKIYEPEHYSALTHGET